MKQRTLKEIADFFDCKIEKCETLIEGFTHIILKDESKDCAMAILDAAGFIKEEK